MEVTRLPDEGARVLVRHRLRLAAGVGGGLALAAAMVFPAAGVAAECGTRGTACKWVATWAASPMAAAPVRLAARDDFSSAGFDDQTIRDIVWTSAGGQAARIALSNQFGTRPVTFSAVDMGISAGGPLIFLGTDHRVTFGGRTSVTIAPGTFAVSDPVTMAVPAETQLAVSLYTRGPTGPATYHSDAQQINYVSAPGDYAGNESAAGFTTTSQHWYFLDRVDVQVGAAAGGTIVAFGDSITDGWRSTVDTNDRWPNDLARRLLAVPRGQPHPVVDEGISGNRILANSVIFGVNAQARFLRDAAALPGARYVIVLEGVNDIGFSLSPAGQIIAGYENLIAAAHAAGLKIFGATLTPSRARDTTRPPGKPSARRSTTGSAPGAPSTASSTSTRPSGIRPTPCGCCPPTTAVTTCIRTTPATRRWRMRSASPSSGPESDPLDGQQDCEARLNRGTTTGMITVPGPAQPAAAGDRAAAALAVHVEGLRKRYGDVVALTGVDLAVQAGEFFTLLGPSGSGKTTLLRLIAGFERPDSGRIQLGGRDVTRVPPYARDVNTVFQDYALFPHMTVAENIEYGLRVRHVPKAQRRERVSKALDMVRLPGLGSRKPAQLSGGQRQRVALARAIVNEPQVLLLDEPLGALDLKLRQEMQLELLRVQREVGITFVYVTHDQEEALTMSDRIAVLNQGNIEQIGVPVEVYEKPRTAFVAGFIGVSNLIERDGHRITVRPEKIILLEDDQQDPPGSHAESGRVRDVIYAGVLTRYVVDLDGGGELVVSRQNAAAHDTREGAAPIARGDRVRLAWRTEQAFTIPTEPGQDPGSGEGLPMMTTWTRISPRPMKIALGLAVASLVAVGCSSSSSTTSTGSSQGAGTGTAGLTVPTANLPVLQKIGPGEGQLNLIAWEGYLQPQWVKPFEQQTGCQVNAKYAGSSDEMVALMKNGGGGQYDMVSSSGDADLRILYAGDAHPVNINLIPSWKDFFPVFKSPAFNTINGVHYGVSLQWGPNVLMYNTKDFPTAPPSWDVIYNSKYKGQVTVPDNPIQIADAALYLKTHNTSLGITDPYELTQSQLQAAVSLLAGQRPLIEKYWDLASQEIFDFKNGNAIVGAGWPYQVSTLKADKFPIGSEIPSEGATGWADTWMLAAKAPHPNCAYMWMQYISTPKVQAEQAINYGETPDNSLACGYMDQMQPGSCAEYHANAPASYLASVALWKTPIATCDNGKPDCEPYSAWVSAWNTQVK